MDKLAIYYSLVRSAHPHAGVHLRSATQHVKRRYRTGVPKTNNAQIQNLDFSLPICQQKFSEKYESFLDPWFTTRTE